jgi:hypothetical protein
MKTKKCIYVIISIILIAIVGIFFYSQKSQNVSTINGSGLATLSDISAPTGWKVERQDSSRIIIIKQDKSEFPDRIDVNATKMQGTMEEEFIKYPSYSFDSKIYYQNSATTSLNVSAMSDGWATINGNLILKVVDRESDSGTAINYDVFHGGVIYSFGMSYQLYNPSTKTFVVNSPTDVQVIQTLVQNFAEKLQ